MLDWNLANWPDMALSVLDHKSPREAMQSRKGRELVMEILRYFDDFTLSCSVCDGSYQLLFDWKSLDLSEIKSMLGLDLNKAI